MPSQHDLLVWRDAQGHPAALGYGVTVNELTVECERVTVTRRLRKSVRRVQILTGDDSETLRVVWDDALKPALYGAVTFKRA